MWPADADDLPQVTTVMCIETAKLCFRQAPSAHVVSKYSSTCLQRTPFVPKTNAE